MKNRLLILFAALAASVGFSVGVQAQTDYTSSIANPSFELDGVKSGITAPQSWTLANTGTEFTSAFVTNVASTPNGGTATSPIPNGSYFYYMRYNWATKTIGISQDLASLPEGRYTLSVAALKPVDGTFTLSVQEEGGTRYSNAAMSKSSSWQTATVVFNKLTTDTKVTISATFGAVAAGTSAGLYVCIDNFQLSYYGIDKTDLNAKIAEANSYYSVSGNAAAAFKTVIDAAQAVSDNNTATMAAITQSISDLDTAILAYRKAQASVENPFDVTSDYVLNPSFEGSQSSIGSGASGETIYAPTNWSITYNQAGWGDFSLNSTNSKDGSKCFNLWSGTTNSIDLYQNITLPAGQYSLSAALRTEAGKFSNQHVYATVNGSTLVSSNLDETTFTGLSVAWNSLAAWQTLTTTSINVLADGTTVRIGAASTGGAGSLGWFQIDNFKLSYIGAPDLTDAVTNLQAKIDEAQTLYDANVSAAILNAGIWTNLSAEISSAVTAKTSGSASTIATAMTNLQNAIDLGENAVVIVNSSNVATSLIENPSFETNTFTGWTNTGFSLQSNTSFVKAGTYYAEKWTATPGTLSDYNLSQTINNLPNGYYVLSAAAQSTQGGSASTGTYLYAGEGSGTPELTEIGASGTYAVTTQITNGVLAIGFKTQSTTANWVSVDNFELTYLGTVPYVVAVAEKKASIKGAIDDDAVAQIASALANATSADFSKSKANSAKTIPNVNPNLIAYNVPASVTVENAITAGCTKALSENYAFYAPTALTANVSYVRSFTATSGASVSGWQSIVLPFNVTAITATQGGNTINLVPFSTWDQTTESTSARPFWLYKAEGTTYVAASSIEANVPYLISIPNDASYADFYNVSGDVTFTGTALAVTSTTVGALASYSIVPNFNGNKGSVYALNAAGSQWESGKSVNSFHAYATSNDASSPKFIPIFGDGETTGIKDVFSETTMANKAVTVFSTEAGVTIVSKNPGKVAIYTDGGLLLKVVPVGEGSNFVTLASGKYIINATVVIVK